MNIEPQNMNIFLNAWKYLLISYQNFRSHSDQKPFSCSKDDCDRNFKSDYAKKKHERNRHRSAPDENQFPKLAFEDSTPGVESGSECDAISGTKIIRRPSGKIPVTSLHEKGGTESVVIFLSPKVFFLLCRKILEWLCCSSSVVNIIKTLLAILTLEPIQWIIVIRKLDVNVMRNAILLHFTRILCGISANSEEFQWEIL